MLHGLLRTVAVLLGLLLVSLRFLHESEEKEVQEWLEEVWIRIDDARCLALSKQAAFVREVARLYGAGLDRMLGPRVLSGQAVIVSGSLSLSILLFLLAAVVSFAGPSVAVARDKLPASLHSVDPKLIAGVLHLAAVTAGLGGLIFGLVGTLPLLIERRAMRVWYVVASLVWIWVLQSLVISAAGWTWLAALGLGLLCDVAFVAFSRYCLRRLSASDNVRAIVAVGLGQCVMGLVLLVAPPVFALVASAKGAGSLFIILFCGGLTNAFDIAFMGAFVGLCLVLLAHRSVWPLVQRPIYALQKIDVLANHQKALFGLGILLVTTGIFGVPEWTWKWLGHFL